MAKVIYLSEKKTMAQVKLVWILIDFLGIPLTLLGFIFNLDNVKSAIIAVLAIIYLMFRMYYYVIQKKQSIREKDIELQSKTIDLWHKEQEKIRAQSTTAKRGQ